MIFDLLINFDKYLYDIVREYGTFTLILLFIIVFFETGVVVTPFLPGDSLIFAAGSLAAIGLLNPILLFIVLSLAAIMGDSLNFLIGKKFGNFIISNKKIKLIKAKHIEKTHTFFERHGSKTIVLARFIPVVRTLAPFVAGIGNMRFWSFAIYNVFGGMAWVSLFLISGYLFGNIPAIKDNFSLVIVAIVLISLLPMILGMIRVSGKQED